MAIDRDHLDRLRQDLQASELTSLNSLVLDEEDSTVERIETLPSLEDALDPEQATASAEAKDKFRRAFARLSERERELAVLLYVKNLTLREVGDILGVSESRVCQIHGQLKRRLREQLGSEEALFSEVA